MVTFAKILLVIFSVLLIITVLLQSGRSAGLSGAITGGAEQMMGRKARGMDAVFAKITAGLAIGFILLSVWVAWLVTNQ
ncbi:preprotein translocase subunit SecG [Effusibacillus lacus]|uniref:Protein-export membrane protein SecG n=1 Tax=Effusibacillus lacus TaxID=1348429 RepID=A0A292YDZ2_9BACL|nr:preprotein translocase subunit SecG [Effusibacillus lacus]TCS74231.1 preprotein translocase subunit SecG [Effusibacillus lacus]GAX90772.1 preprotein translocase subunit SecG [Effusibacillus lacus]